MEHSDSRTRLWWLLSGCVCLALLAIWQRGYPGLAAVVGMPAGALCLYLYRQPEVGTCLRWYRGRWSLWRHGNRLQVDLRPGSVCLPGLVQLRWREHAPGQGSGSWLDPGRRNHRQGQLWLFSDSVCAQNLWLLRRRLMLDH